MCKIFKIQFTQCSHSEQQLIRCQESFDNGTNKVERRKKGWLRHMFSSFSRERSGCDYSVIYLRRKANCNRCSDQIAERYQNAHQRQIGSADNANGVDDADEKSRQAFIRYQAEQRAKIEEQTKRFNFQCSLCAEEKRNTASERNPAVNRGLCCSRGLDECYAQGQRRGEYGMNRVLRTGHSPLPSRHSTPTDKAAVPLNLLQKGCVTPLHNSKTQTSIKITKSTHNPPKEYMRDKGPYELATINPGLLDYFSASRRIASPMKYNPGIMWDRWAQMVQTHHGRYPPAECSPKKPLPPTPTADNGKKVQRRVSRRDPAADLYQQHSRGPAPQLEPIRVSPFRISAFGESRKSLEVAAQHSDPPHRPNSQVLVPKIPAAALTTTSPDLPAQPLRSVASKLEDAIDGAIEFWSK